jgi:hypothetical protein
MCNKKLTNEFPALLDDFLYANDRLHKDIVGDTRLWDPYCAEQVYPLPLSCLLESTTFVWAQDAGLAEVRWARGEDGSLTTGFSGDTVHFRHNHCPSGIYGIP